MEISRVLDKTGSLGAAVAALGCASCFPALGAIGAAVGLGLLAQFEGVFINTLLPAFALIGLLANGVSGLHHRRWWRMALALTGPALVLATLYLWWSAAWSTPLFYLGLGLMLAVSLWDLFDPPAKRCPLSAGGPL